jgi:hypothetical protein
MKADVAILGTVALVTAYLFWTTSSMTARYADPVASSNTPAVPRSIIQAIVEKIQQGAPWLQPVNTVFINPIRDPQGGTNYNARLMFLDTRGFFGEQYDVTASVAPDGNVNLLKNTHTSSPSPGGVFERYVADKYQSYSDVRDDLAIQLRQATKQFHELPGTTKILA